MRALHSRGRQEIFPPLMPPAGDPVHLPAPCVTHSCPRAGKGMRSDVTVPGPRGVPNARCRLGSPRSRVPTPRPPRTTGVRTPVGMAASPVTSIAEYRRMYVSILSPPSSFLVHANHALRFVRWLSDDASISLFPFRLSNSPARRPLRHAHSKHTHACAERHI